MSASPQPVITLGCRLNIAESEAIRQLVHASHDGRDVAVVNSCGVTNQAVKDTRAAIRRLRRDRPNVELIVTGCASDMDRTAFEMMPEVDRVVANAAKLLPSAWGPRANTAPPRRHTRGFVGVQNGCDHACTFCAIPQGRGHSRSDPIGEIVHHVATLVEGGQREVVLSGVDLTSYDDRGARLPVLIERLLAQVPALQRLRLSSLDPAELDDHLFALLSQEPRIMPHVHLSLQAGDDLILKRMRRRHNRAQAIALAQSLKAARPEITIGADLIAGFPTESEPAHANTLVMVDEADITHAHVFPYSPRDRTPAARMPQVAPDIARTRATALRTASAARRADWLAAQVGTVQPVLVERPGNRGHTPAFADLHLAAPAIVGSIVNARVIAATPTHLIGTSE